MLYFILPTKTIYAQRGPGFQTKKQYIVYFVLNENNFVCFYIMESPAFFFTFFLWFLLLSVTGYSVYVSFGPPSKKLRDPFEEHED